MGEGVLDLLQAILDCLGFIPMFGDVCDCTNCAIYFARGDKVNSLISAASAVFSVVADVLLKPLRNSKSVMKVAEVIKDKFGSAVSKIASWIGAMAKKLKGIPLIGNLFDGVADVFKSFKKFVTETFEKVSIKVKEFISSIKNKLISKNLKDKAMSNLSKEAIEWLNEGAEDTIVYFAKDTDTGIEVYTGITKQALDKRLYQHNYSKKHNFSTLIEKHNGLTKNQARAIEQYYIEHGPNIENKINSIAKSSKFYKESQKFVENYLEL